MKFEALMLRGLLVACTMVCALILGAMLNAKPGNPETASSGIVSTLLASAPSSCALPPDGVVCPWSHT
jgi:hypothetical protein